MEATDNIRMFLSAITTKQQNNFSKCSLHTYESAIMPKQQNKSSKWNIWIYELAFYMLLLFACVLGIESMFVVLFSWLQTHIFNCTQLIYSVLVATFINNHDLGSNWRRCNIDRVGIAGLFLAYVLNMNLGEYFLLLTWMSLSPIISCFFSWRW